jgi:hypothetical protein
MKCRSIAAAVVIAVVPPTALMIPVKAAGISPEAAVNRGVVQLETARAAGISVRIAEDLASIIDDGATRRVLPVIGQGSLQKIRSEFPLSTLLRRSTSDLGTAA